MKRVLGIFVLCGFILSGTATFANNGDIMIWADVDGKLHIQYAAEPGSVVITMVKSEDYHTDFPKTTGERFHEMLYMDQLDDISEEAVFLPAAENGTNYTAIVRHSREEQNYAREFTWYDQKETQIFFDALGTDPVQAFSDYSGLIDLYCGNYSGLSAAGKTACISYFAQNRRADFADFAVDCQRVLSILQISDINQDAITEENNVLDNLLVQNQTIFGLAGSMEWERYENSSAQLKAMLAKRLVKERICESAAFLDNFKEQFYLTQISLTVNYSQIKDILINFDIACGLDISAYFALSDTKNIDSKLVGGIFADQYALADFIKNNLPKNGSGGGTSTGGSGKGGDSDTVFASLAFGENEKIVEPSYCDVPAGHWAQEAIAVLSARGVIAGYKDGTFMPSEDITRAEFLTLLLRAFDFTDPAAIAQFSDVEEDDWYFQFAATGQHYGIISGFEDGTFRAADTVIRQDAACMMANLANVQAIALSSVREYTGFSDSGKIADYAAGSVLKLYCAGIINGYDNSFAPRANLTRAEAAQLVFALIKAAA